MSATAKRAARERLVRGDSHREGPGSRFESGRSGTADRVPHSRRRHGTGGDEEDPTSSRTSAHDPTSSRTSAHDPASSRNSGHGFRRDRRTDDSEDRRSDHPVKSNRSISDAALTETGQSESRRKADSAFIKVVTRVRPKIRKEAREAEGVDVELDGKSITLTNGSVARAFGVDEAVDSRRVENNSQATFFDRVARPSLLQALQGYNVCIFAYGHTGSGKTYTMLGDGASHRGKDDSHTGILPRFLREIFDTHAQTSCAMRYSCEFYEVYNEQIRDLLAPMHADRKRTIHVHPKLGVKVDGIFPSFVSTCEEALDLVNFGNQMRTVAATTMNERSSRSHAIFTFRFELSSEGGSSNRQESARDRGGSVGGVAAESTITFVDLAGREDQEASANQAMQYREMCYINTSLFHLAHLITKLSESSTHREQGSLADFRNSKLTLLLSQALVGNSRSLMVATLAPLQAFYDDSVSTMSFAQSVKRIQTKPVKNNKNSKVIVADLEDEVRALRDMLSKEKTSNTEKEQELMAAQHWALEYKRSWEEAVARSEEMGGARKRFATNFGLADADRSPSSGEVVPFFTKLCDDPALQGCCNYFLREDETMVGSDSNTCGIVVIGVGILPVMCEVRNLRSDDGDDPGVEIQVVDTDDGVTPRVLVNGKALKKDDPERIEHGDSIILGHSNVFRLVMATFEQVDIFGKDPSVLARNSVPNLDMATALAECIQDADEDVQHQEVLPYVQQLSMRSSEEVVQTFFKSLNCMSPCVDEANVITKEVWPQSGFFFKLHVLTDCFDYENDTPELIICVMQNPPSLSKFRGAVNTVLQLKRAGSPLPGDLQNRTASMPSLGKKNKRSRRDTVNLVGASRTPLVHELGLGGSAMSIGKNKLLYVWSLEKFLRRLKEFREIYQEGSEVKDGFASMRDRLTQKAYLNPWREMNFVDVKHLAEEFGGKSSSSGKQHGIVTAAIKAMSPSPPLVTSPTPTPRFVSASYAAAASSSEQPAVEPSPAQPRERAESIAGLTLQFPAISWPAPPEFEDELWKSLASLGSAQTGDIIFRLREAPDRRGIVAELHGHATAVEDLRKTPLSKMAVLGAPVGDIHFQAEIVPRLALSDTLGLAEASIDTSVGTSASGGVASSKPRSLAEAVRAYVADGSSASEVKVSAAEPRDLRVGSGEGAKALAAVATGAGVVLREDSAAALPTSSVLLPTSLGASPPAEGSSLSRLPQPTQPPRAAADESAAALVMQMRELISDLKKSALSNSQIGDSMADSRVEKMSYEEVGDLSQGDIDELRNELNMCKAETGRMFSEQGRLAFLLERFETLLLRVGNQDPTMPSTVTSAAPSRTIATATASEALTARPAPVPVSGPARAALLGSPPQRSLPRRNPGVSSACRTPSPQRMTSPRSLRRAGAAPQLIQQVQSAALWQASPGIASVRSFSPEILPRVGMLSPGASARSTGCSVVSVAGSTGRLDSVSAPSMGASASVPLVCASPSGGSLVAGAMPAASASRGSSTVVAAAASPSIGSASASPAPAVVGARRQFSPSSVGASWTTAVNVQTTTALPAGAQVEARRGNLFSQIDSNHDGVITRAEFDEAIRSGMILEAHSIAFGTEAAASFSVPSTTPGITPLATPRATPWVVQGGARIASPVQTVEDVSKIEAIRLTTPSHPIVGRTAVEGSTRPLIATSAFLGL